MIDNIDIFSAPEQPSVPSDHELHSDLDIDYGSVAEQPEVDSTVSTIPQSAVAVSPHCPGPAETVGQVGHLPYHYMVINRGNDVL